MENTSKPSNKSSNTIDEMQLHIHQLQEENNNLKNTIASKYFKDLSVHKSTPSGKIDLIKIFRKKYENIPTSSFTEKMEKFSKEIKTVDKLKENFVNILFTNEKYKSLIDNLKNKNFENNFCDKNKKKKISVDFKDFENIEKIHLINDNIKIISKCLEKINILKFSNNKIKKDLDEMKKNEKVERLEDMENVRLLKESEFSEVKKKEEKNILNFIGRINSIWKLKEKIFFLKFRSLVEKGFKGLNEKIKSIEDVWEEFDE